MSRTPSRHNVSLDSLNLSAIRSPKSPAQEPSPLTRRLLVILEQLTKNYTSWSTTHKKGISVCRSIETIKCKALEKNSQFPEELKPLCEELEILLKSLEEVVNSTRNIHSQITALVQLDKDNTVILKSWNTKKSQEVLETVLKAFEEELKIKTLVKENIAFCKSHADLIHMSCVWEYQYFVDREIARLFRMINAELR